MDSDRSNGDDLLKHFWRTKQFAIDNPNMTKREKADTLRQLLFFLQQLLAVKRINETTHGILHKELSLQYTSLIDSEKGLDNYSEMMTTLLRGKKNESQSWTSSLSMDGDRQPQCFKDLLSKEKTPLKTMKISFSKRPGNDHKENSVSSTCNDKTAQQSNMRKGEQMQTTAQRPLQEQPLIPTRSDIHVPRFGKRKQNPEEDESASFDTNRQVKKKNFTYEKNNNFPQQSSSSSKQSNSSSKQWSSSSKQWGNNNVNQTGKQAGNNNGSAHGRSNSYTKQASNNRGKSILYGQDELRNDHSDDDSHQEEHPAPSPFKTAGQKLVVDLKKSGKAPPSSTSSSSLNYGQGKKSLGGARRGVGGKFVPPIGQEKTDSSKKQVYGDGKGESGLDSKYEEFEWMKNVDPKMVELIENEIMDHGPQVSWDDIAGLEFAKTTIQEIVIWPMLRPDIFTGLRGPPKGLLLFGPPGTGKTLIGKCIASQSNAQFFNISASSLTSKWIGEGEKMVRALFGVARCQQPAVIFIDEIDSLLTQRSEGEHESSRRIKTEFLVQLDGATASSDDRILVVGATNRPQELDEAARRRLVKRLYIPLPDGDARKHIVKNLMSKQPNHLQDEHLDEVMDNTSGFSGADMANLCREAALGPIRSITDIRNINADEVRPVNQSDFMTALKHVRPSVSQKDLQQYVEWNRLYGSGGGF